MSPSAASWRSSAPCGVNSSPPPSVPIIRNGITCAVRVRPARGSAELPQGKKKPGTRPDQARYAHRGYPQADRAQLSHSRPQPGSDRRTAGHVRAIDTAHFESARFDVQHGTDGSETGSCVWNAPKRRGPPDRRHCVQMRVFRSFNVLSRVPHALRQDAECLAGNEVTIKITRHSPEYSMRACEYPKTKMPAASAGIS